MSVTNSQSSDEQELAHIQQMWAELPDTERHDCAIAIADEMTREEALAFVEALKARPDMKTVLADAGLIDG